MASASSSRAAATVGYYDEYSDPELDTKPSNGRINQAKDGNYMNNDQEDDEDDGDEDDFVPRPHHDSPPPIPYQPPPNETSAQALKRKASDPVYQAIASSSKSTTNGGANPFPEPPSAKRQRPEPLEASILCAEPLDEFVMEIADWVHRNAQGRSNVEVEAKVGMIIDTRSDERINLPVSSETILAPDYPEIRFSSNMTVQQYAQYNQALNKLVERANQPTYPNARIRYEHARMVDTFHTPVAGSGFGSGSGKIRVTTDAKTGEVKECVQKTRIADLNIYSPKRKLDWRVSVSTETPVPLPPSGSAALYTRRKDRLSYTHQSFKVDLTQVTPSNPGSAAPSEQLHELEIEFADSNELMRTVRARTRSTGATWTGKEGELFDELMRIFVNNIRILVRNAG
ncbi:mRNA-capping enzyme subunit beta [Tulasnella sp. 403]|nr:mRNA-capping enzyme subunit beta [Tulasnella sp. 403]